jgi:hypothetical protein
MANTPQEVLEFMAEQQLGEELLAEESPAKAQSQS